MTTDLILVAVLAATSSLLAFRSYRSFVEYQQVLADIFHSEVVSLAPTERENELLGQTLLRGTFSLIGLAGIAIILTK